MVTYDLNNADIFMIRSLGGK